MALYKKLDLWSITDGLDRMMDYCYNGNEKGSPYWGYYYEQINELSIAASVLNHAMAVWSLSSSSLKAILL